MFTQYKIINVKEFNMNKITLPTGFLFTDQYSKGELETLSIGDYGKAKNIKADFLGYTRELNGVPSGDIQPLQEKWVITLSTQYGCPMKCTFCDVPEVKFKGNATFDDLKRQLYNAFKCFPDVKYTDRLNIHFARMGEPSFNEEVLRFTKWLTFAKPEIQKELGIRIETIHPVFTSMLPDNQPALDRILKFAEYKNEMFGGQAGLQLSINSTNDEQRNEMFGGQGLSLERISELAKTLPYPIGRKYCLNIAYASGNECDGEKLAKLFDPDHWMVKITPIHNNNACRENGIETVDGYNTYLPYKEPEENFKKAGFDVLVFVPSQDEEDGLVTCGNAILGGSELKIVSA